MSHAGRIVSVAVMIAINGRRETLGMASADRENETVWNDFLRSLDRRGQRGVKLIILDAR